MCFSNSNSNLIIQNTGWQKLEGSVRKTYWANHVCHVVNLGHQDPHQKDADPSPCNLGDPRTGHWTCSATSWLPTLGLSAGCVQTQMGHGHNLTIQKLTTNSAAILPDELSFWCHSTANVCFPVG